MLDLLRFVNEVVRISLRNESALIWLLNKILIALLLRKHDGILLGLEVQMSALHIISRRLPTHQRVFPAVALLQHIPIHPPVVLVPGTGLRGGLRGAVDSEWHN